MKRVGITGGIGCGKSTVVAEFRKLGVSCFICDNVAARYYDDKDFLDDLRELLGDEVFSSDGSVNKQTIAARVFADRQLLDRLNALIHPRVMEDFDSFCQLHENEPYVLFESAILYDYGFDRLMDCVVCVYLDMAERMRRLLNRDGVGEEQFMARINNQMPAEEMMDRADYVVLNYEGNPRCRQVAYIDKKLKI